jgi:hypothetical protein
MISILKNEIQVGLTQVLLVLLPTILTTGFLVLTII